MTDVAGSRPERRRKLSACIIARNEARHIEACIRSLSFADEVVVVDSFSDDGTAALARAAGARVIEQEFLGHVRQKQLAVDSASHDLVFCADADERASPELASAIEHLLTREEEPARGYEVARHTFYLGRFIDHGGWWPEWRLRLFDRRHGAWSGVDPHDHVRVAGRAERLPGELLHYNYRDLSHHVAKIDAYTSIIAERRVAAGEPFSLLKLVFWPPARFFRMYVLRGGFRDGLRGFLVAWMGAFYVFMKYAKLWERRSSGR
ncbi:MAG: glycosyltransferase family 2 protein, partial [Planctomycetes bacterium]|nr:glycosyltransferase family 2 protein [Planctomycetota bacterium]